ncbi:MAG: NAD(P)-binding protein, partial [Bacteroidaceae bacterium]|nr:NAD(P)-binding protein [Bacteroidaceae bacterium]
MFDRKRVVIIGSGLGGLSCGTILQKNGFDVTVVEQGTQPGGCLQCFERKGAKFETGMHFIGSALPGQTMHSLMNYLGLLDDVKLSQLDENGYDIVSLAGQNFSFANGREPFIETMASYFPKEKDNIRKYYDIVKLIASSSALHSLTSSHRDDAIHAEYQLKSINDELDQ